MAPQNPKMVALNNMSAGRLTDMVDGKKESPPIGPFKGINKDIKGCFSYIVYKKSGFKKQGFWLSLEVLEGLERSGRLVGTISTYPGTCQCPW